MSSGPAPKFLQRYAWVVLGLFLFAAFAIWILNQAGRSRVLDLASPNAYWTANITGTTGDVAQVWIWTPGPTLLTNLPVPSQLRLNRREVLIQVRSAGNLALNLDVDGGSRNGSAHVRLDAGKTNSAEFASTLGRIPLLPLGAFTAGNLPPAVPLGLYPVYEHPWSTVFYRYDVMTNLALGK